MAIAAPGDTIAFAPVLNVATDDTANDGTTCSVCTIQLIAEQSGVALGAIAVDKNLTITGPGSAALTIRAAAGAQVFHASSTVLGEANDTRLKLTGMTLVGGDVSADPNLPFGGVVYGHDLELDDVTATGGTAVAGGGVLALGAATIRNSVVSNNTADGGGGLYANGDLTLDHVTVSGNTAARGGGGLFVSGSITMTDSAVTGNAGGSSGFSYGGGIYATGGTIDRSSVADNRVGCAGGGIWNEYSGLTIRDSTISGNSAFAGNGSDCALGGGVYGLNAILIVNSTLSGNQAAGGAAARGAVTLINSTVVGNELLGNDAPFPAVRYAVVGNGTLVNTLVADTVNGGNCNGISASNGFSTDTSCDMALVVTDGQLALGPLADNGGPTKTHALLPGSVAIDAVADCGDLATDQRGVERPQNGVCDVGAFEYVYRKVNLDTEGVIRLKRGPLSLSLDISYSATLNDKQNGLPVAGRSIHFTAGLSTTACDAVTDAQGVATCGVSVNALLATLLGHGYTASFAGGDRTYEPANDHGTLVKLQ